MPTPSVWRRPGTSPSAVQASSKGKAGLKVRSGLTSEASAPASARVASSVATQLSAADPTSAAANTASTRGKLGVQASTPVAGAGWHCVSTAVPAASSGREAAFTPQATSAGRARWRSRLLRTGSSDVRTTATSASKAYIRVASGSSAYPPAAPPGAASAPGATRLPSACHSGLHLGTAAGPAAQSHPPQVVTDPSASGEPGGHRDRPSRGNLTTGQTYATILPR